MAAGVFRIMVCTTVTKEFCQIADPRGFVLPSRGEPQMTKGRRAWQPAALGRYLYTYNQYVIT
jgi:hypothetical protein